MPPEPALAWVLREIGPGAVLVRAWELRGGGWHANHLLELRLRTGRRLRVVLRRWARAGWEIDDPDMTVDREAGVLQRIANVGIAVPMVIATDPTGEEAGVPALLETVVRGRQIARPRDPIAFARALAGPLVAVHAVAVDPAMDAVAIPYRRYYDPAALRIPGWAADPSVWERALELASGPEPEASRVFIHRDYHPGNVLWERGAAPEAPLVSGLVDWTSASFGPPQIDVGHMRWNLAAVHGAAVAHAFLRATSELGIAPTYSPEWDIRTALDVLPELRSGHDPMTELRRIEAHVATAIAELG